MAMESKGKKSLNIKEDFERRNINAKSIMDVIKFSLSGIKNYMDDGKSFILYVCGGIEI